MASRWDQIMAHNDSYNQLVNIYQQHFPIEVRYFLCTWLEEKQWNQLNPDNPACEAAARDIFEEMLTQLSEKTAELSGPDVYTVRKGLEHANVEFQNQYKDNPLQFVRVIKNCLAKEAELLAQLQGTSGEAMESGDTQENSAVSEHQRQRAKLNEEIIQQLQELHRKAQETENQLKRKLQEQERFIILYQENITFGPQFDYLKEQRKKLQALADKGEKGCEGKLQELMTKLKDMEVNKRLRERNLSEKAQLLLKFRLELTDQYSNIIQEMKLVQLRVQDDELIQWKRRQQLAGNGMPSDKQDLDMLQQWCEMLAELLWGVRQQIKKLGALRTELPIDLPPGVRDLLPDLNDTITGMLSSLVTSTFIVEQQPPQVLKKEARFSATVRLLVGGKLNVHMNPPKVKATIISEMQTRSLMNNEADAKNHSCGNILNNTGTMEFQPPVGHFSAGSLSVHFRNMQLKSIKRSDKKGMEAVTEEKFCILFQSDFNVGGNDLVFQVWTLSLPVVVTVHGNQECNAMATILWDNAFSEAGRRPFVVPECVPWPKLAEQLHSKFVQMTDRGLTSENLDYLASKIFNAGPEVDYSHQMVSWAQFNKETLKDRTFTFWEWFYAVHKLTKEHLRGPWADGSIIGFISKMKAQENLNRCENGTFLLRFSDSECGGVTIAWIAECPNNPAEREVWNLAPYVAKDFTIRSLGDRIKDLKNLTKLYPNTYKDEAFSKYYTAQQDQEQTTKNGYISHQLVTVIPQQPGAPMCDNQSVPPQSPQVMPQDPFPDEKQKQGKQAEVDKFEKEISKEMDCLKEALCMLEEIEELEGFLATDYEYDPVDVPGINIDSLTFIDP